MIRNSLILVASFGLMAGCATSSATNTPQNPDAGNVKYDVGAAPNGGTGADAGNPDKPATDGGAAPQGRDSTSTKAVGFKPAVKKIAAAKPPKADPAPVDPKVKPTRKGREVSPNGLLAETFTIEAATQKLPDFAALTASGVFIAPTVDAGTTGPLAGAPATLKAPTALRFSGSLNVTEGNEYKLCTKSSDGSALLIEDILVVDNDGVHATPAEVCEIVSLEPGEYKLEIRSFHVSGSVTVVASWAVGKDGTPAVIPTASLFKPEGADARIKAKK